MSLTSLGDKYNFLSQTVGISLASLERTEVKIFLQSKVFPVAL